MSLRRLTAVAIVVTAFLMVSLGSGIGPLVFEDDRLAIYTWEQVNAGVDVVVCNVGPDRLQSLRAELTGFNFQIDKKFISDRMVLNLSNVTTSLDAGICTQVHFQKATNESILDPGEYKGLLVISGPNAGIIRRELTVYGPAPTKKPAMVESVVDEITIIATRKSINLSGSPFFGTVVDKPYVPLKSDSVGDNLSLPNNGTLIGVIYNNGNLGRVYVNGKPDESLDGIVLLPVRIDGLDAVGTYSGNVDVGGTGDDMTSIKVQVKVTDYILWAIIAIIIGVLIPLLIMFYIQRWRPRSELNERRNLLAKKYEKADKEFREKPVNSAFIDYHAPNKESIGKYLIGFDNALNTYAQDNWLFDTASADFKKIIKMLDDVESDAQHFGDPEGFGKSLKDLYTALEGFDKFLSEEFPVDRQPALVKPSANLLRGDSLTVGATQKIVAKAKEYIDLINAWQVMAAQIKRYSLWSIRLSNKKDDMTSGDWEVLQRASAKVLEAKNEILDAKDVNTLADLGAADDLKRAYGQLAYLGGRYGVWEAPEERKDQKKREEGFNLMLVSCSLGGIILEYTSKLKEWLQQAKFVGITPEEAAVIERQSRWIGDAGVIGLAVIVAILTGLTQLYFDKTFGTLQDYLTVILIGAGSQVALKGLVDTITQLRRPLKA